MSLTRPDRLPGHFSVLHLLDFPEIEGIDINPIMVLEKGAVAVDARIALRFIPSEKTG